MSKMIQFFSAALLLVLFIAVLACTSSKAHRVTDLEYSAKPADASIDVFVGKLARPYEIIAIVDSKVYQAKDDAAKDKMAEDLMTEARKLGADAVQDIRLLPVKHRGMIADKNVPIPGAVKQGRYQDYFLRGEAIKYVEQMGAAPMQAVEVDDSTTSTLQIAPAPEEMPVPVK